MGGTDAYPGEFPHQVRVAETRIFLAIVEKYHPFLDHAYFSNLKSFAVFCFDASSFTTSEQKIASRSLFFLQLVVPQLSFLFIMVGLTRLFIAIFLIIKILILPILTIMQIMP